MLGTGVVCVGFVKSGGPFYECPIVDLGEGLIEFLAGVHHDRATPCDRFVKWSAGEKHESEPFHTGFDVKLVTVAEKNRSMARFLRRDIIPE